MFEKATQVDLVDYPARLYALSYGVFACLCALLEDGITLIQRYMNSTVTHIRTDMKALKKRWRVLLYKSERLDSRFDNPGTEVRIIQIPL